MYHNDGLLVGHVDRFGETGDDQEVDRLAEVDDFVLGDGDAVVTGLDEPFVDRLPLRVELQAGQEVAALG